jgi:hypothetical protein
MSAARPVFAEFADAARRHLLAAAVQHPSATPGRDAEEQAAGLARLCAIFARYTSDLARTINQLPNEHLPGIGPWHQAALQVHDALTSGSRALGPYNRAHGALESVSSPAARSLHAAARSLAVDRDLLQGHFTIEPSGVRLYRSGWSPAITSPGVSRAILAEVASLARQTAAAGNAIASTAPGDIRVDGIGRRMSIACYWLSQPETFVSAAERAHSR